MAPADAVHEAARMDRERPRGPVTRLRPLTERILDYLPGPRALWVVAWALVPTVNAGVKTLLDIESSAVAEQSTVLSVLNYAALTLGVVLTLWGTRRIVRRLDALRETTAQVFEERSPRELFRGMNSVVGPIVLATAIAVVLGAGSFADAGWLAAILRGASWFVLGIAFWTFLWVYGSLQLGLDRLGQEHVRADAAMGDPGLGLRPLGGVAFMGLWMLLAWLVPIVLTGLPDVIGVVIGVLILAAGLAAFFLSLVRLHRQMVDVKARELAIARRLFVQAYEPVRDQPTVETLERQQRALAAADALERRAHAIHDWPIDEGTFARVLTIATSVVGITIARLILDPFGL